MSEPEVFLMVCFAGKGGEGKVVVE